MHNEVGVMAGVGLDQKTRKSHWPARLDLVQSLLLQERQNNWPLVLCGLAFGPRRGGGAGR